MLTENSQKPVSNQKVYKFNLLLNLNFIYVGGCFNSLLKREKTPLYRSDKLLSKYSFQTQINVTTSKKTKSYKTKIV